MTKNTLAIGSDHAGFETKEFIIDLLKNSDWGFSLVDVGTYSADSVDYPDFAHQVSNKVVNKEVEFGVVICGSGNGVCMAANKHTGIRAALCWTKEIAVLARQHNDANVLCIPGRFVSNQVASEILQAFLTTTFEGGRHSRRVEKISI